MRNVRFAEKSEGGYTVPHLHLIRYDGVVHVVKYTEGPSVVFVNNGTPVHDEFRINTHCGKTVKMYCGGRNRITAAHPTCVQCIGATP